MNFSVDKAEELATREFRRLRELEHRAGSLPVLFALFFHESLKALILSFGVPVPNWIKMGMGAVLIAGLYVYDVRLREAAQAAKEKAEEKYSNSYQAGFDEYGKT